MRFRPYLSLSEPMYGEMNLAAYEQGIQKAFK